MRLSLNIYRTLLAAVAVILVATAALHATGLGSVAEMLLESGIPANWTGALEGLWLMFSVHLVLLAGLLIVLAVGPAGRAPLAVATAFPIADTVLLLAYVGVFIGSIMTGLAALLLVVALIGQPRPE